MLSLLYTAEISCACTGFPTYLTHQRQAHTNTYDERSPQSTLAALRTLGAAELNALAIPEPSVSSVWHRPWSPVPGEETVKEMTCGSVSFPLAWTRDELA